MVPPKGWLPFLWLPAGQGSPVTWTCPKGSSVPLPQGHILPGGLPCAVAVWQVVLVSPGQEMETHSLHSMCPGNFPFTREGSLQDQLAIKADL